MTPAPTSISLCQTVDWMRRFARAIHKNEQYLTSLDSAIGDADHGINMERGFHAVAQKLEATTFDDLGAVLKLVGSTLISTVGGASGPLYGTAFLRMGGALAGKASATAAELGTALALAYEGVSARGKSGRGEKTLLDAFGPALDAFQAALARGRPIDEIAAASAAAAEDGATATIPLVASRGRASFLGREAPGIRIRVLPARCTCFRHWQRVFATRRGAIDDHNASAHWHWCFAGHRSGSAYVLVQGDPDSSSMSSAVLRAKPLPEEVREAELDRSTWHWLRRFAISKS